VLRPSESAEFRLFIGPRPLPSAKGEVELTVKSEKAVEKPAVRVELNGSAAQGGGLIFAAEVFRESYNAIRVGNASSSRITVERVELCVRFPSKK
jgi:hypothetical protein